MHDLSRYLPTPSTKGQEYNGADWHTHDKELSEYEIHITTRDGMTVPIRDELDKKDNDY